MKNLTSSQRDELISQYVEIVVDSMDHKSLEQYVFEQMATYVDSLSDKEIKEEIDNHDEELYDELVDNVTSVEKCQTWEELKEANSNFAKPN